TLPDPRFWRLLDAQAVVGAREHDDCRPDLIDSLRTADVTLTYDSGQQTLRCNEDIAVTIGNGR
ncbi:MAG TPA: hypothetical protein VGI96_13650, partial [Streptosporangiaceae bacterium]